jgi:hypothetical protein
MTATPTAAVGSRRGVPTQRQTALKADHTADTLDGVGAGQPTTSRHQNLAGPLKQQACQHADRHKQNKESDQLNNERQERAGESPGQVAETAHEQDVHQEKNCKGNKSPPNRRFTGKPRAGADHGASGRPQQPDGHGQDIHQLEPEKRDIECAEQDDLSHDRQETDGKQGPDHGCGWLSPKTWARKV